VGTPTLQIEGATVRYGEVVALDRLDLVVHAGETVGLLGHNGAGKTTTVRLTAGLVAAAAGTARVLGRDPVADGPAVRALLGVLPARGVVDDRLTAVDNLRFAADTFAVDPAEVDARVRASLAAFELEGRADERVSGFSTGMRQRLSLARVLLSDPRLLLLDEPTAALDPVAARSVRRVLAELARDHDRTVVLCTHDLAEAEQLCDRVIVLEEGRVVADGRPAELAAAHGTGGVALEVDPEQRDLARHHLAAVAVDVEVEGGGRLRGAGVARAAVPGLLEALHRDAVAVFELRRLDPSLEDVYLALHRDRGSRTREVR
jgi:ABC-2 type transport system ATP-binding protein